MGPLCFTSFNQSRNPPISTSAKGCYLEALTHSSRNHGVEGAAEKGRPEGRGQALLFASEVRVAAFLPKSINCGGGGGVRPEDSGERAWGDLSSSSSSSSVREVAKGNKLVGGDGKALLYGKRLYAVDRLSFRRSHRSLTHTLVCTWVHTLNGRLSITLSLQERPDPLLFLLAHERISSASFASPLFPSSSICRCVPSPTGDRLCRPAMAARRPSAAHSTPLSFSALGGSSSSCSSANHPRRTGADDPPLLLPRCSASSRPSSVGTGGGGAATVVI